MIKKYKRFLNSNSTNDTFSNLLSYCVPFVRNYQKGTFFVLFPSVCPTPSRK